MSRRCTLLGSGVCVRKRTPHIMRWVLAIKRGALLIKTKNGKKVWFALWGACAFETNSPASARTSLHNPLLLFPFSLHHHSLCPFPRCRLRFLGPIVLPLLTLKALFVTFLVNVVVKASPEAYHPSRHKGRRRKRF